MKAFDRQTMFFLFLAQNDALDKFIRNSLKGLGPALFYQLVDNNGANIMSCFSWTDTPEGHQFWLTLDYQWDDIVLELEYGY